MRLFSLFGLVTVVTANSQLEKTIQLLGEMKDTGEKEMKEEQVAFAKHNEECKGSIAQFKMTMANQATDISSAKDAIAGAEGEIASLEEQIRIKTEDINNRSVQMGLADQARKEENDVYVATEKDLSESVSALTRASAIAERLHEKNSKIQQAAFLQMPEVPEKVKSLLQQPTGEAAAYESQSGGIVGMLQKLLKDFKKEQNDMQMAEMHARQAHEKEMEMKKQLNKNDEAKKERDIQAKHEQEAIRGENAEIKAKEEASLKTTTQAHEARVKECNEMQRSFDDKQELRGDEITAISQGVDVLCGIGSELKKGEVCRKYGSFELVQKPTSFLQMTKQPIVSVEHIDVGAYLRKSGVKLHSKILMQLAERAANDPFAKIKSMIAEMIDRLEDEALKAQKEANHCRTAKAEADTTLKNYNKKVNKLKADTDRANSTHITMTTDVASLDEAVKNLESDMATASEARIEEKEKNLATIQEAKESAEAVNQAIGILNEFYSGAASATALLQVSAEPKYEVKQKDFVIGNAAWNSIGNAEGAVNFDARNYHQEGEDTFGETFTGQQDKSSVVIGILEVVESDFSRIAAETREAEDLAERDHNDFVQESKLSLTSMGSERDLKNEDGKAALSQMNTKAAEHKEQVRLVELEEIQKEEMLKDCPPEFGGTKGVISFEERASQRAEEIESLKVAHSLLKDANVE